jgi:hypothetical protein
MGMGERGINRCNGLNEEDKRDFSNTHIFARYFEDRLIIAGRFRFTDFQSTDR